jgi:MFS family permease
LEAHFALVENAELLTRLALTMPALFIALCAPFAGVVADRFGRRRLLFTAMVVYSCAGMSGLFLDSLTAILAGRALLGVAVAATMTVATALIADYFSGTERDRFMGLQSSAIGFSGLVFLTGGGLLAEWHWRAPFAVYGLAFVLLPAAFVFLREPLRAAAGAHAAPAGENGHALWPVFAVFGAAVLNSVIFYMVPTQLPFYVQAMEGDAPARTGLMLGAMTLVSALVSLFFYARVRARLGLAGVFAVGFALTAAGNSVTGAAASFAGVAAGLPVIGMGMGLVMPNLATASMYLAPPSMRGRAAGGLTASIFAGQFISPLISQPVVAHFSYDSLYLSAGATMSAVAALTLFARRHRRAPARGRTV